MHCTRKLNWSLDGHSNSGTELKANSGASEKYSVKNKSSGIKFKIMFGWSKCDTHSWSNFKNLSK